MMRNINTHKTKNTKIVPENLVDFKPFQARLGALAPPSGFFKCLPNEEAKASDRYIITNADFCEVSNRKDSYS